MPPGRTRRGGGHAGVGAPTGSGEAVTCEQQSPFPSKSLAPWPSHEVDPHTLNTPHWGQKSEDHLPTDPSHGSQEKPNPPCSHAPAPSLQRPAQLLS